MNTLTKVLMTAALLVVGYFLFIGLFYVVAAGVVLMAVLYGFSWLQKMWRRLFGGDSSANHDPANPFFSVNIQRGRWDASQGGSPFSRDGNSSAAGRKQPATIKVIDVSQESV